MPHLVLLGDSVLDNAAYTAGGPPVIDQVAQRLPAGWKATLCAIDGSMSDDIGAQLARLPPDATHLLLSVGGNDALMRADVLQAPVAVSGEAFALLHAAATDFEAGYRRMLDACLTRGLPLVTCTIYHGNFPDPVYQQCVAVALTVFNDVILRVAAEHRLRVLDLRSICTGPADYANPIEPSSHGGAKIADAIVSAIVGPADALCEARLLRRP